MCRYFIEKEATVLFAATVEKVIDSFLNKNFNLIIVGTKWSAKENHFCTDAMV